MPPAGTNERAAFIASKEGNWIWLRWGREIPLPGGAGVVVPGMIRNIRRVTLMSASSEKKNRVPEFRIIINKLRGDLSQEEFAKKIGISRQTLGLYESGDRIPDIEVILKFAKALNVTTDYLLGRAECSAPEDEEISKATGLSEKAIMALAEYSGSNKKLINDMIVLMCGSN
jgi:transcriptional regulator with XRE-family HTH domain